MARTRILLVDDSPEERALFHELLEGDRAVDAATTIVGTLQEASRALEGGVFDVVLLDLNLPDASGLETVRRVRERAPRVPVVVLTGVEADATALAALKEGAQDYLVKGQTTGPVLSRAIRYAVERARVEEVSRALAEERAARVVAESARVETDRLNRALDETNRAVLALYGELDERAEFLRRASDLKSRFLSNVSHELRTPLNSIVSLAALLHEQIDGPLTTEQQRQIGFIRAAAESLAHMVDDLLDLAKIEAGKAVVRTTTFSLEAVFAGLKGMLRPLHRDAHVALVFEDASHLAPVTTDEAKVGQIVRNFVTNALKFTERGEVRVSAAIEGEHLVVQVKDTGIGIPADQQERIFDEFTQVDGPIQRRVKGTGLGLPLARSLAALLGGTVEVESEQGEGSTFRARLPKAFVPAPDVADPRTVTPPKLDPTRVPVLVVEDDIDTLFIYERHLRGSGFQVLPARTLDDARRVLEHVTPAVVLLDVLLERESSWDFLAELKRDEKTRALPVLVVSVLDGRRHAFELGAEEFCSKPIEKNWLLARLKSLSQHRPLKKILIVDDEDIARYLLKGFLSGLPYDVVEAAGGREGLEKAKREAPDAIFLDIVMPDLTAFEVLAELKKDPATRDIPVIINTSKRLDDEERLRLASSTAAILTKEAPSRQQAVTRIQEALAQAGIVTPAAGSAKAARR